jgi:hypothetical protein
MIFCKRLTLPFDGEPFSFKTLNAIDLPCSFTNNPPSAMPRRAFASDFPNAKCDAGDNAGPSAISQWKTEKVVVVRPLFPPMDRAMVVATACQSVAETGEPLSRQSLADLTRRVNRLLDDPMSKSTVWRTLDADAIKPWQYEHWIFPRDPQFRKKAGPILDLYAGFWQGQPLTAKDFVLSCDEKTSIQARQRKHPGTGPKPHRRRRVEPEYKRQGALQYLAAWDVHRGIVTGRCEAKTGIAPFGRLVDQILASPPYADAERLFLIVDNGSSHRGRASIQRLKKRDQRMVLLHTPVHASWLNQVEIYFSIIQRKVLTPNDFANLSELKVRLRLYEELSNRCPKPFQWKFTRQKLEQWLQRVKPHFAELQTGGDSLG